MLQLVLLVASVAVHLTGCSELKLISTIRTSILAKYDNYVDALLFPIVIPKETTFAALRFAAEEIDISFFNKKCPSRRVSMYMKYGAPPVINPDGSRYPDTFKPISRELVYNLEFDSDKSGNFLNLTSPYPGTYMAVIFLAYKDNQNSAITQQGLTAVCQCYGEAKLFIEQSENVEIIVDEQVLGVTLTDEESKFYKFAVPDTMDQVLLILDEVKFPDSDRQLVARVAIDRIPSNDTIVSSLELNGTETEGEVVFASAQGAWHYLELFVLNDNKEKSEEIVSLTFKLRFFTSQENSTSDTLIKMFSNSTELSIFYNNTIIKRYKAYDLSHSFIYKEYALVRDSSTENFLFSYLLEDEVDSPLPVALNLTSNKLSVMKFKVYDTDIGGTANFVIAFKNYVMDGKKPIKQPPVNQTVVACIRPYRLEIPFNPGDCYVDNTTISSPMKINATLQNASIQIPFPEAGLWFVSFRVFCGKCEACSCPSECGKSFTGCMGTCYRNCTTNCTDCRKTCEEEILEVEECKSCGECDGPCKKTKQECNSLVVLDISSEPCVGGTCGANGKCAFMLSSGVAYSSCVCLNNYRGWDCRDGTKANPQYIVILEWVLLVFSNLAFLPAIIIAIRRKYYVEAVVYASICFFSSFYHSCDAGENRISFCLTRKGSLQFADFFCALLSVWVTLIAMADIPSILPNILHVAGAIIIAFITTVDKMALWVLALPSVVGVLIIIFSWTFKYRKVRQLFCKKNYLKIYLPIGLVLVIVGLLIYSFLQTTSTYKYLHSLWHIIMAMSIIILLPKTDTFQPDLIL